MTGDLDAEIVERTRSAISGGAESDAAVVERALNAYLLGRMLDATQARSTLTEDAAQRLASDELRASRRQRDVA